MSQSIKKQFNFVVVAILSLLTLPATADDYKGYKYKGHVDVVTPNSVTIRENDAELLGFIVSSKTDIVRDNRSAKIEELQREDLVTIIAERSGKKLVALSILAIEPE